MNHVTSANGHMASALEHAECKHRVILSSLQELQSTSAAICGNKKLTDKNFCIKAVGTMLLTFLSVIMKGTHAITCLRTLCE